MAVYLFMHPDIHSASGEFKDAVAYGGFKVAPMLDSNIANALAYCESHGIKCAESNAKNTIKAIEKARQVVLITSYEDAKIICNHFTPDTNEE